MPRIALPAVAVLLTAVLAGCSGDGKEPAEADFGDLDLDVTSDKGIIRGIVVDDAIRPIAGAEVTLQSPGSPRTTTSSPEGLFGFDQLEPGTYFVRAAKLGFASAQSSVDVAAGVKEPPIVRILLAPDADFKAPYFEQYTFEGFIECSTGVGAAGGYAYLSACSSSPELFPNDKFATSYVLSGYPQLVQSEMTWESTQAVSRWLSHAFYYDDAGEEDGYNDLMVEGESPLINTMDAAVAQEYIDGPKAGLDEAEGAVLAMRMFTTATDGTGPALTVQQRFTVYTTIFYGYLPPQGWTLIEAGEVPAPPQ